MSYQPPPYQPNPQMPPYPGPKRPWWKALWFVALVALIVGVAIGAGSASGTKKNAAATPGPTVTATTTATATASVTRSVIHVRTKTAHPIIRKIVATHVKTRTVTYTPPPPRQYGEGTYVVGVDIAPGTYRTSGARICYWARLSSLNTQDIIDNSLSSGPQTIEIFSSDKALQIQGGCTFGRA
jgi:hypothetical protein